jgi:hypothetical protein
MKDHSAFICQEPLTQQYRAMSQKIGILNNTAMRILNVTACYDFSGEGWILFCYGNNVKCLY